MDLLIFDLDGTLIDSRLDLANAVNATRAHMGLNALENERVYSYVGNGAPAIVCRFEEQTTKGFMWRDIGLGEWLFDLDQPEDHARIAPAVLSLASNPTAARKKTAEARQFVEKRQRETMQIVRASLF